MDAPGAEAFVDAVNSMSPFNEFPKELMQHIFNYFGIEDKKTARLVSKEWKTAINNRSDITFRVVLSNRKAGYVQNLAFDDSISEIDSICVEDFNKTDLNIQKIPRMRKLIFGPDIHQDANVLLRKFLELCPVHQVEALEFYNTNTTFGTLDLSAIDFSSVRHFKYTMMGFPWIACKFETLNEAKNPIRCWTERNGNRYPESIKPRTMFFGNLIGALSLPSLETLVVDLHFKPWISMVSVLQFYKFYDFLNRNQSVKTVKINANVPSITDRDLLLLGRSAATIETKFDDLELSIHLEDISAFQPILAIRDQLKRLKLIEINGVRDDLEGESNWCFSTKCLMDLVVQNSSCLETLYLKMHKLDWADLNLTNFPCLIKLEIHLDRFENLPQGLQIQNLKNLTLSLNHSNEPPEIAHIGLEKLREWVLASKVGLEELAFPHFEEFDVLELRWVLTKSRIHKILLNKADQDLIQGIIDYCAQTKGIKGSWVRSEDYNDGSYIAVANNYLIVVNRNVYWDPLG